METAGQEGRPVEVDEDLTRLNRRVLRSELLKYARFITLCYACYDHVKASGFEGNPFFHYFGSHLNSHGYDGDIYHEFYRGTERRTWFGFVSVSTDGETARLGRKNILVAFRGSGESFMEWSQNITTFPVIYGKNPDCTIPLGFQNLFQTRLENDVRQAVKAIVEMYEGAYKLSITFVGHSLGGVMAVLCAHDIASKNINIYSSSSPHNSSKIPINVITFGSPKVGNRHFRDELESLGVSVLGVVRKGDLVPKWPPRELSLHMCTRQLGVKLVIGSRTFPSEAHKMKNYEAVLKSEGSEENWEFEFKSSNIISKELEKFWTRKIMKYELHKVAVAGMCVVAVNSPGLAVAALGTHRLARTAYKFWGRLCSYV